MGSVLTNPALTINAKVLLSMPSHYGFGTILAASECFFGGTCIILDPYDPEEALRLIDRHKIEFWTAVPTMLLRIKALPDDTFPKYDLSSLKALTATAAAVPQSLKNGIVDRIGTDVLWGIYGRSEAGPLTIYATGIPTHKTRHQRHTVHRGRHFDR